MALFDKQQIGMEVVSAILTYYRAVASALFIGGPQDLFDGNPGQAFEGAPLMKMVSLLVQVANGEIQHDGIDVTQLQEIMDAQQRVVDLLCVPPFTVAPFHPEKAPIQSIPKAFWQTSIGMVVARVQFWLHRDSLISLTEAVVYLYGQEAGNAGMQKLQRLLDKHEQGEDGGLQAWPDPTAQSRQRSRKVLLSDVQRLKEWITLPG